MLLTMPAHIGTCSAMLVAGVFVIVSGAVRVSQLVHPPLLLLARHHTLMAHSQSAIRVSWTNYFTGACTLLGAECRPVCLLPFTKLCLL